MELVHALERDHKILKRLYKEGLKEKTTWARKKAIFSHLCLVVPAHAKSEEKVLYDNVEDIKKIGHYAFEGFEEHHLVDQLLKELKAIRAEDIWNAKFTVVCELLKHHVEEEEEDFFPQLKRLISDEVREMMGSEYTKLFAQLKKSPRTKPTSHSIDIQASAH